MVTFLQELELQEDTLLQCTVTKLELQKATHGAKLELLEATLVTLESYKRRCTVLETYLAKETPPTRPDRDFRKSPENCGDEDSAL